MKKENIKGQYRVGTQIHAREVRIVGDGVESQVVSLGRALDMAHSQGVDLVEISPNAEPPVCRLIDYSKFIYQQK
ncbi:MAG: translation initiation factor IF-3, partial [Prevotella sp.]|nr:translation initiation factor IF-3 [Prevotella sp.]